MLYEALPAFKLINHRSVKKNQFIILNSADLSKLCDIVPEMCCICCFSFDALKLLILSNGINVRVSLVIGRCTRLGERKHQDTIP